MTLTVPDNALRAIGDNAEGKIRLWAAVKGYELDELSADEAAELAGLSKVAFLRALGQFGSRSSRRPRRNSSEISK